MKTLSILSILLIGTLTVYGLSFLAGYELPGSKISETFSGELTALWNSLPSKSGNTEVTYPNELENAEAAMLKCECELEVTNINNGRTYTFPIYLADCTTVNAQTICENACQKYVDDVNTGGNFWVDLISAGCK